MDQLTASRHADRIRELDDGWLEAAARRDLDGMMAIYAPEAQELLPGLPPIVGREAIRKFYRELIDRLPRFQHAFTTDEVTIAESGDLAIVRGTYQFIPDSMIPDEVQIGKFVGVWLFSAGDWKLQINISNSDGPA